MVESSMKSSQKILSPSSWSAEQLEGWLLQHAAEINPGRELRLDGDLFDQGFDRYALYYVIVNGPDVTI